jgi:hydrogenase small subunit
VPIERPLGPDTYPAVYAEHKGISPVATGLAGIVGGAIVGAGILASKKFDDVDSKEE